MVVSPRQPKRDALGNAHARKRPLRPAVPRGVSARHHLAPADQEAANTLILTGLQDHFGELVLSLNGDLDDIHGRYAADGHVVVVAELDGQLVGTGILLINGDGTGNLVRMSISREHRRKGIGRALVMHLLAEARQRSLREVLIKTNNDWHDAIGLYLSCGFVEYGATTRTSG
jgi:GNAT superfamily N-acetyltransferase